MTKNFERSLNCLRLDEGVPGVRKLEPYQVISEQLPRRPQHGHLYIVVELPKIGMFPALSV
jgi:hypothetical protein